jgi:septal ring factor EnvC (AmiA/AmiB activator)
MILFIIVFGVIVYLCAFKATKWFGLETPDEKLAKEDAQVAEESKAKGKVIDTYTEELLKEEFQEALTEVQRRVGKYQKEISELEDKNAKLQEENEKLQLQLEKSEAKYIRQDTKLARLEAEVERGLGRSGSVAGSKKVSAGLDAYLKQEKE